MSKSRRVTGIIFCCLLLAAMYLFQQVDYLSLLVSGFGRNPQNLHPNLIFIVNKTFRLLVNDTVCILMIYLIFLNKRYAKVGFVVQLIEITLLLPLYFWLKLTLEGTSEISSPMLSQIHRLIVNPTLMILLIVALYHQEIKKEA